MTSNITLASSPIPRGPLQEKLNTKHPHRRSAWLSIIQFHDNLSTFSIFFSNLTQTTQTNNPLQDGSIEFEEFIRALSITSRGNLDEKLNCAFFSKKSLIMETLKRTLMCSCSTVWSAFSVILSRGVLAAMSLHKG